MGAFGFRVWGGLGFGFGVGFGLRVWGGFGETLVRPVYDRNIYESFLLFSIPKKPNPKHPMFGRNGMGASQKPGGKQAESRAEHVSRVCGLGV